MCGASRPALVVSVCSPEEATRFWAFCAFEACMSAYYPVLGMLGGTLIVNEHRATVSLSMLSPTTR